MNSTARPLMSRPFPSQPPRQRASATAEQMHGGMQNEHHPRCLTHGAACPSSSSVVTIEANRPPSAYSVRRTMSSALSVRGSANISSTLRIRPNVTIPARAKQARCSPHAERSGQVPSQVVWSPYLIPPPCYSVHVDVGHFVHDNAVPASGRMRSTQRLIECSIYLF